MAVFSALPNELLLSIFSACDIQATIHLSATCQRLRQIWLKYDEEITASNLGPTVVDFEGAKRLAVDEARCLSLTAINRTSPPAYLWVPRMLHNSSLAAHMLGLCRSCKYTFVSELSDRDLTSAYYVRRRVVLSYTYRELRKPLYRELLQSTEHIIETQFRLEGVIGNCKSRDDLERQGMLKDWSLYDSQPPLPYDSQPWIHDEWQWSRDVIMAACEQWDRPEERGTLKRALCPDPNLSHLPTELVLSIFRFCEIKDAVRLSSTCHRFHQVWFEHADDIIRAIFVDDLEHFEEAKNLAILEARLLPPTATTPAFPSVHLWLPRMLENASLASELDDSFRSSSYLQSQVQSLPRRELFSAYYLLRRLRVSYSYRPLRAELYEHLLTTDAACIGQYFLLRRFMFHFMTRGDKERHGMVHDWDLHDLIMKGYDGDPWLEKGWRFALGKVSKVYYKSRIANPRR